MLKKRAPKAAATALPPLTIQSRVVLNELVIHREPGRDPLIGSTQARRFVEVDEHTISALDAIRETHALEEAERRVSAATGDSFDLVGFVSKLCERGFVKSIDGVDVPSPPHARERHPWLHAISPKYLKWLHHPLFIGAGLLLVCAWLFVVITLEPALRPRYHDLFVFRRPALVMITSFTGILAVAYLHELAHFLMARSFGIDATIHISHRFYIMVLQTNVTNAWILPRRQRIAIFLAGIAFNLLFASAVGLLLYGMWRGHVPLPLTWTPYLRFLIYLNIFPLAFQLFIFARTDLYHLLLVLTNQRNLMGDSANLLRYRARRLWLRIRKAPASPCARCHASTFPDDPFCLRCGAKRAAEDPNRWPFEYQNRHGLLAFGLVTFAGILFGYYFLLFVSSRFMWWNFTRSWQDLLAAAPNGATLATAEAMVALFIATIQLEFVAYFAFRGVIGWIPKRWIEHIRNRRLPWAGAGAEKPRETPQQATRTTPPAKRSAEIRVERAPSDSLRPSKDPTEA